MSSANTFGTFLETTKSLNQSGAGSYATSAPLDLGSIAKALSTDDGVTVPELAKRLQLSPPELMTGVLQGKQNGVFDIDTAGEEPLVKLTTLGRSFL